MASITLNTAWTQLSQAEQMNQWRAFLSALDAGGAGYHPYYLELMPLWDRGDVPAEIEAEAYDAYEAEMRAEAGWDARYAAAWGVTEGVLEDADTWPAAGLDELIGSPPF